MSTAQEALTSSSFPQLKLYYFDIQGKGEAIRLYCAYAGLPLEDVRLTRDEFQALRADGQLAFGQVPLLQVTQADGKVHSLVQSAAILRYLSILAGKYPLDNPLLAARIDALLDQETDAFIGTLVCDYTSRFGIEMTEEQKTAAYQALATQVLPRHLTALQQIITSNTNNTGWLADTVEPSIADFVWYVRLQHLLPAKTQLPAKIKALQDYPQLIKFRQTMHELPAIKAYYQKHG